MFAAGMGGLDVSMPGIWGVRVSGSLPDWVSAKDVVLEMLRRHGVEGAFGRVIEYHGPGPRTTTTTTRPTSPRSSR